MFSTKQKQEISKKVEEILLLYNHPEMPKERLEFHLKIRGNNPFSWATIEPNHHFENVKPGINPHNEKIAEKMDE